MQWPELEPHARQHVPHGPHLRIPRLIQPLADYEAGHTTLKRASYSRRGAAILFKLIIELDVRRPRAFHAGEEARPPCVG
jgi:hypothetical protein